MPLVMPIKRIGARQQQAFEAHAVGGGLDLGGVSRADGRQLVRDLQARP